MRDLRTSARRLLVVLVGLSCLLFCVALLVGNFPLSPAEVLTVLIGSDTRTPGLPTHATTVVLELRLPRAIGAWFVGAALAASGAAFQNLFRNPLVSPDILGVSSGAALGAIVALLVGASPIFIQLGAFAGGLGAVLLILLIGARIMTRGGGRGRDPILTLVLIGVVVGALLAAAVTLLKVLADPYNQLPAITWWLMGSCASLTGADLLRLLPLIGVGLVALYLLRWRINLLALPDEEARVLGINTRTLRLVVIAAATLMTCAAVAVCGVIGWVGLVVPHAVRLLVGAEFSRLLPVSMCAGGVLMLGIDTLARSFGSVEIPPGVLTAVLGAPVFLWLLYRNEPQPGPGGKA